MLDRGTQLRSRAALTLAAVLALLLFGIPATIVVRDGKAASQRAVAELSGMPAARSVLGTIRLLQVHRGKRHMLAASGRASSPALAATETTLTASFVAQTEEFGALETSLLPLARSLSGRWEAIVRQQNAGSLPPNELFARHTTLIAEEIGALRVIANMSGLAFHRGVAEHYLERAALGDLPGLTETMGQLRAGGASFLATGRVSREEQVRLAALVGELQGELRTVEHDLTQARLADSSLDEALVPFIVGARHSSDDAVALAHRHVIDVTSIRFPADSFFTLLTGDVDAQFALIDATLDALRERLDTSVVATRRRELLVFTGLAVVVALIIFIGVIFRQADAARRRSDSRFRAIINAAPDAVIISDAHGRIAEVNAAALQLYARSADELKGADITSLVPPEARAGLEAELEALELGQAKSGGESSQYALRSDGQLVPTEVTRSRMLMQESRWTVHVVRDTSNRHRLEQQLRHSQKMEAVGQLTGGIAHDFNNLLAVVVGNIDLVQEEDPPADVAALLHAAQQAALRGGELTRRLLAFARNQHLDPTAIELPSAIRNFIAMAARTLGPDIKLLTDIGPNTPQLYADAGELDNVLLNLAVNARDAMPDGGTITIATQLAELDADHSAVRAGELEPGDYVLLRVSDTGGGIPPESIDRIFEPFFSTKGKDRGTGLGLSMVYGFVKQSGGNVKVYSEVGMGTTVSILLPVARASHGAEAVRRPIAAHHEAKPGTTALVVDDEVELLDIAAAYLRSMGYQVRTAADGREALDLLAVDAALDLLITDVMMPGGVNGVHLAEEVRRRVPDVRVIFTSGFPAQALRARSGSELDAPLLAKPFLKRHFTATVAQVMEGAPQAGIS